jgi:hypothetical protein
MKNQSAFARVREVNKEVYEARKSSEPTANSPKNKYRAQIHTNIPIGAEGQIFGCGAMTIEDVKQRTIFYTDQAKVAGAICNITIIENKKQYPEFEWVAIERYLQD